MAFKEFGNSEEGFDKWLNIADEIDSVGKKEETLSRYHCIETEEF